MARHRSFVRGASAIRSARKTTWFQFLPVETTLAGSAATSLVFALNAVALAMRPFTIVRTHWYVKLQSDQAASVENQAIGVGLGVVSDRAVAVGVSAVPLPISQMSSSDWFLHTIVFGDGVCSTDTMTDSRYVEIDSKAMRKVEIGEDIVVVLEGGGVGAGSFVTQGGRMLVKNN